MGEPEKIIFAVGLVFSILLALYDAGTAYNELYNHNDPRDSYPKKEAIRAGIRSFVFYVLLSAAFAYVLPRILAIYN